MKQFDLFKAIAILTIIGLTIAGLTVMDVNFDDVSTAYNEPLEWKNWHYMLLLLMAYLGINKGK